MASVKNTPNNNDSSEMLKIAKSAAGWKMAENMVKEMAIERRKQERPETCKYCRQEHETGICQEGRNLMDRWRDDIRRRRCNVCFGIGHRSRKCFLLTKRQDTPPTCDSIICADINLAHAPTMCPFKDPNQIPEEWISIYTWHQTVRRRKQKHVEQEETHKKRRDDDPEDMEDAEYQLLGNLV